MLAKRIAANSKFYIYGAQVVAYGAYLAIRHLWNRIPERFLVSTLANNPSKIEGVLVDTLQNADRNVLVIVAVTELLHGEIITTLTEAGFTNIFLLTQHEEHLLMSAYFAGIHRFPLVEEGNHTGADIALYEVCNHRDKQLEIRPLLQKYEYPIQAGAAIADKQIAPLFDNTGDNISAKNKQYCEMTATYWVWKNTYHEWKGIEHYRRHLLVTPAMLMDDVNAILPLPYICYPDTLTQFRRFVGEDVLHALLNALQRLHPEEYECYLSILHGQYQYTYNLVCARCTVFDDYCAWFFHISEYMETMADDVPALMETRALSYVAEVLTNLYFMSHQNDLHIKHVEKAIYV